MLITITELLNSGLPISSELEDAKLSYAINTSENYVLKPLMGDELYMEVTGNPEEYGTIISGGTYTKEDGKEVIVTGLKKAMLELAFSELLFNELNVTIFSTVKKKDDYSSHADHDDVYFNRKLHLERGIYYIKEALNALGKKPVKDAPNFDEFL